MKRHLPVSDEGQKPTKIGNPSDSADSERGFATTNHHVCSVLMHPMGLPLLIHLNDVPSESYSDHHLPYVRDALNSYQQLCTDDVNNRNHVFAATVLDWQDGSETDLTSKLVTNMEILKLGMPRVTTYGEYSIGVRGDKGRVDFLFQDSQSQQQQNSVVGIFEFAIDNREWWKKQDQLLKYVKILQGNPNGIVKFDGPVLLSVITIDKGGGYHDEQIPSFDAETITDKEKLEERIKWVIAEEQNMKDMHFEARFGVFLCTPKGDDDFRLALLWRHETKTLVDASMQFGKVLYAVQLCSYLREYCKENQKTIQYEYLSPNCCKFGTSVRLICLLLDLFQGSFRHETMLTF